ncbi:MAG TPA: hypothetical protein VN643_12490 [Pyrinomonadaceae bacterium]|nr:hypothetical protein [Pyrinomonadaceae bacterium]
MSDNIFFYRRNLPHWHPPGKPIFVTWRLKGSLPQTAINRLRRTHQLLQREANRRNCSVEELNIRINKKLFAMLDEVLDRAEHGPTWLRQPKIADMIQNALLVIYAHLYRLWAYVVMPNHVHVLLKGKQSWHPMLLILKSSCRLERLPKLLRVTRRERLTKFLIGQVKLFGRLNHLTIGLAMQTNSFGL